MNVISDVLFIDTQTASESLEIMLEKECRESNESFNYLNIINGSKMNCDNFTSLDRTTLVDWCYSIVDHSQLNRENVAIAMDISDRYLSRTSHHQHKDLHSHFQLLVMSALYIAIKLNEQVIFSSEQFASISCGMYSVEEIEEMELKILKCLGWNVHTPTSLQLAFNILPLLLPKTSGIKESTWLFITEELKFQTELAVRDFYFTTQRKSTIAIAALFNAFNQVNDCAERNLLFAALFSVAIDQYNFSSPKAILKSWRRLSRDEKIVHEDAIDIPVLPNSDTFSINDFHDGFESPSFVFFMEEA